MSYPDALQKLKSVYDRVSSNVADVLVEIELYEDLFKKSATDINNLLKRFNIDNWHFYTPQPRSCFRVEHINDDVMEAQNKRIYNSASSLVSYPSPSSNLSGFREDIDKSLLSVIRRSRLNLPLFMDRGVKTIRTIESLVTEDLRRDLSDIATELNQSYENVMRMISKVQGISDSYRKALTTREQQAANEWFAEGLIRKGDLFNTLSFEDPIKVEKIENGIIYTDAGGRWEIDNLHPSVIEHVWEINHPQFKVDDLIKPLDSIADWRLAQ